MDRKSAVLSLGTKEFCCTVCRENRDLTPFEKRQGNDGVIYDLWLCLKCGTILNATHLKQAQTDSSQDTLQSDTSDEFYGVDENFLSDVPNQVAADGFTDFLISQCPDLKHGVALDFGAGRGITAASAANVFEKVYAAELTLNVLSLVHERMPRKDRVFLTQDYLSIPEKLDAIYSMHTLEHLPHMRDFVDQFVLKLADGGVLFFQVPLLKRDHLVFVHYTFFTEASCRTLAHETGLDLLGVWYDHSLDFLTCIMRKPLEISSEASHQLL